MIKEFGPMTWKGVELKTWGDIRQAVSELKTHEEAQDFLCYYKEMFPRVATTNLMALTGRDFSEPDTSRLRVWFGFV